LTATTPSASTALLSSSIATASSKKEGKSSSIDQFLRACGDAEAIDEPKVKSKRLTINEELKTYKKNVIDFHKNQMPTAASSLNFWKKNYIDLPILAQLARVYLSAPGTSIASESAFSISSYVARKERARLSADYLSFTMFIKDKITTKN
jgi:hypothetical protein